jgi:hypothetical protein
MHRLEIIVLIGMFQKTRLSVIGHFVEHGQLQLVCVSLHTHGICQHT